MGKFKVGDRVRIASGPDNGGYGRVGDTGIIEAVGRADCFVRYDSGSRTGESWYVGFDYLEPAATDDQPASQPQLTLQPGKHYMTRDGRKVGPASPRGDTDYPWWVGESAYTDSGAWVDGMEDGNDLVADVDEPANDSGEAGSTAGFTVPLEAYGGELEEEVDQAATIADIVRRLEKLEASAGDNPHRIGDRVTLRATVTGIQKKNRVNITLDDVSGAAHSIVAPAAALTAA